MTEPELSRYSNSAWIPGPVLDRIIDHLRWVSVACNGSRRFDAEKLADELEGGDTMTGTTANTDPIEYLQANMRQVTEVVEELAKHLHIQQENLADTRHRLEKLEAGLEKVAERHLGLIEELEEAVETLGERVTGVVAATDGEVDNLIRGLNTLIKRVNRMEFGEDDDDELRS